MGFMPVTRQLAIETAARNVVRRWGIGMLGRDRHGYRCVGCGMDSGMMADLRAALARPGPLPPFTITTPITTAAGTLDGDVAPERKSSPSRKFVGWRVRLKDGTYVNRGGGYGVDRSDWRTFSDPVHARGAKHWWQRMFPNGCVVLVFRKAPTIPSFVVLPLV